MLQKFFPKLEKLEKKDILLHGVVLLGMLGLACILLSGFDSKQADTDTRSAVSPSESESTSQEGYRQELEAQLTEMLGAMAGVGRVKVLVTLDGSEEYCYAQSGERLVSGEQVRSSTNYVTVGGSSREPLLESVSHPSITGVVVVCDGGGGSSVQEAVYSAVAVACGLPTTKIYVTKLET